MHSDFSITGFYNKVKETFGDVWDSIDWSIYKECAAVENSKEVWDLLHASNIQFDWNKYTEQNFPKWDRKCTVRAAIRQSVDYGIGWGEGKTVKLPVWFNKEEYDDIFDEVLKSYQGYQDLDKTNFVNGYDAK